MADRIHEFFLMFTNILKLMMIQTVQLMLPCGRFGGSGKRNDYEDCQIERENQTKQDVTIGKLQ